MSAKSEYCNRVGIIHCILLEVCGTAPVCRQRDTNVERGQDLLCPPSIARGVCSFCSYGIQDPRIHERVARSDDDNAHSSIETYPQSEFIDLNSRLLCWTNMVSYTDRLHSQKPSTSQCGLRKTTPNSSERSTPTYSYMRIHLRISTMPPRSSIQRSALPPIRQEQQYIQL